MQELFISALKFSKLSKSDKKWISSRLDETELLLFKNELDNINKIPGIKKIGYKDILNAEINIKKIGNASGHESKSYSSSQFSILDQYGSDVIISAFKKLPPIIVATYFSHGESRWLNIIQSEFNADGINITEMIENMDVPSETFYAVEKMIYEIIENAVSQGGQ